MEKLQNVFLRFAEKEAKGKSALYEYWCLQLIHDEQLLKLVESIPMHQPKPNLFFASVQYLSKKLKVPIYRYFLDSPNINFEKSFIELKSFCNQHKQQLIELFQSKLVQTNEVNRASYLYPIFSAIYEKTNKPLTIIEIGTSAGLLLNVDQYFYEITQQNKLVTYGKANSKLIIRANNKGKNLPILVHPIIKNKIGIDINCLHLEKDEDTNWLQALIWPEQKERLDILKAATIIQQNCSNQLITGNFNKVLPELLKYRVYAGTQIVIFHTHVANQLSEELKNELNQILHIGSFEHPIYHVYNNMYDANLHVDYIEKGEVHCIKRLTNYDNHGTMFEWNNQ